MRGVTGKDMNDMITVKAAIYGQFCVCICNWQNVLVTHHASAYGGGRLTYLFKCWITLF